MDAQLNRRAILGAALAVAGLPATAAATVEADAHTWVNAVREAGGRFLFTDRTQTDVWITTPVPAMAAVNTLIRETPRDVRARAADLVKPSIRDAGGVY